MTNSLSIFSQAPKTKADINDCIAAIKSDFLGGDMDVIAADLFLKKIEELVKGVREDKEVKRVVLQELEKYTEKTVNLHGCQISKIDRSNWQYDLCNDVELQNLETAKKEIDEEIKARQKVLQAMKKEQIVVTPDGSIETVYPASKTYTSSFSIKIL